MAHTAKWEDIADVKTLIANVETLIERKEATMMRFLVGILTTSVIAIAVALFRTFI